jgi:hypothetical protein
MLYPFMLVGLAGLAIPILLHLIQRQRLKPQLLATLQFLDPQDAANAFAPVPRDLLQLLLRLALLGLFVLLMARLLVSGESVGPRTLAVILDASLSMQRKGEAEQSLFERHKEHVLDLIAGMGSEDRMSLALVGDWVIKETAFLRDPDELGRIAQAFEVSDGGGLGLVPAIRRAVGHLGGRREVNGAVVVFSDHLQGNYQPYVDEVDQEGAALRATLAHGRVKLLLMDELPAAGPNLSIEQASFSPARVYVGASSRLTAVVRNHSDQPQTTQVRLTEGEQTDSPRSLTLQPGEAAHIDLVHRFDSPIDSACRVEIEDDVLRGDNRYFIPMRIRDRRQVLLVAPPGPGGADERGLELGHRAIDLLAYALNPGEALGKGAGTYVTVKRVSPPGLARVSLPIYSLVILFGVTELPEQAARDLAAFVDNGGGVWLIPEGNLSPLRFNETYGPLLGGFALGALKTADPVQTVARDEAAIGTPLFLPLLREEWGNLREIHFSQYYGVQGLGSAKVALRAGNGEPLAALVARGRGQVFVQVFSGGLEGGSLPRSTAFVPLAQQLAATLGRSGASDRPDVLRVGEVAHLDLPEFRGLQGDVQVAGPQKVHYPLTGPDSEEVRVEGLLQAGAYEVTHPAKRTGRQRWLAVNPVLGQSELRPLKGEGQAALFGTDNVERLAYGELAGQFAQRREVVPLVLMLVFGAFAVEALIGAWQSRRRARLPGAEGGPP